MTAIDIVAPARPAMRITLPTFDLEPIKARVADLVGMPIILPGSWYL